ncbi:MAG: nucleotidyltransferase family protein [Candidatus Omnitrophica bacterium]|nr:nucleotidyltransferase family protein [Candidatus Omnitrophota bacterium]
MKALILAAGYATRLYPLTREYAKPLLKVKRRPIIDYIIDKLEAIDEIDEIFVVTNSKFFSQFRNWQRRLKTKKRITLVDDLTTSHADRRGAIGDMYFVVKNQSVDDDLLVIGGDNLFDGDLSNFVAYALEKKTHPIIGAYNIRDKKQCRKYGVLKIDEENRVIDFQEKPKDPDSTLVAMCLYYFPKGSRALIKEYLAQKIDKHDAT